MPPRKPTVRLELEWSSEAWAELRTLPASERRPVMEAAARLAVGHRKPSSAIVNVKVEEGKRGPHELLYRVVGPLPPPLLRPAALRPRIQILCALVTGTSGAVVARPGLGELRRRGTTLRKIGGGIPHEVVRRAWLAELRRQV